MSLYESFLARQQALQTGAPLPPRPKPQSQPPGGNWELSGQSETVRVEPPPPPPVFPPQAINYDSGQVTLTAEQYSALMGRAGVQSLTPPPPPAQQAVLETLGRLFPNPLPTPTYACQGCQQPTGVCLTVWIFGQNRFVCPMCAELVARFAEEQRQQGGN